MALYYTENSPTQCADALDEDTAKTVLGEVLKLVAAVVRFIGYKPEEQVEDWLYPKSTVGINPIEFEWARSSSANLRWVLSYGTRLALRIKNDRAQELFQNVILWIEDHGYRFRFQGFQPLNNALPDFHYLNNVRLANRYAFKQLLKNKKKQPVWVTAEKPDWV